MPHKTASFHFFGSLSELLPAGKRGGAFAVAFQGEQSVKHLFESCGVPHTEVGEITANEAAVSPKYIVQDGDRIEIKSFNLPDLSGFQNPSGLEHVPPRFVLDIHLGRLAGWLRLLGFDAAYRNDLQDDELAHISSQEGRALLTRDRRLLMRSIVTQGCLVRSLLPQGQVEEVLTRYDLFSAIVPFGRCGRCNGLLEAVDKQQIIDQLQPLTKLYFDEFQRCTGCGQVYWKGSHTKRFHEFIQELQKLGDRCPRLNRAH